MNLREFTEAVDEKAGELSREELLCFLHSITRKVPEEERENFLETIAFVRQNFLKEEERTSKEEAGSEKGNNPGSGKLSLKAAVKKADEMEIRKELGCLTELFDRIREGELTVWADGYEHYYEDHWGSDWVWEYEDEEQVGHIFEDGAKLLLRCVNDGFYEEAETIFNLMIESEVTAASEWDGFELDMKDMVKEGLAAIDLKEVALNGLYAVYQSTAKEHRAEKIYRYFSVPFCREIRLEDMLSVGREELGEQPEFWDSWIALLAGKNGDVEERLLKEAVCYQRGGAGLLEIARLSYEKHPSLYMEALVYKEKEHDLAGQREIGDEALEKIDVKYVIRSEIALKTAEAAIGHGKEKEVGRYYFEAFSSNTTPVNYLRLLLQSPERDSWQKKAQDIIQEAGKSRRETSGYDRPKELEENWEAGRYRAELRFFSGDFTYALEQCSRVKKALGWSGTFVKCGLSLFLLLLYRDEDLKPGCSEMARQLAGYINFHGKEYFKGTDLGQAYQNDSSKDPSDSEILWKCFLRWRKDYPLSEVQEKSFLSVMEKLVDKRVKAIISGQHRGHYHNVAALAAALGEVRESMGMPSGKERTMQKYREEFPRHSSFHAELRSYGMCDTRKSSRTAR